MWSIGVILFILLGGYPPFEDDNLKVLYRKICKATITFPSEYWVGVSEEAKDLIRKLLTLDQTQRITVQQAIEHPWLGKTATELSTYNLECNLAMLRKLHAKQKLRAVAHTVVAMNRLRSAHDDDNMTSVSGGGVSGGGKGTLIALNESDVDNQI